MKSYTITVNGKAYAVTVEEGAASGVAAAPAAAPVAPAAPAPAAAVPEVAVQKAGAAIPGIAVQEAAAPKIRLNREGKIRTAPAEIPVTREKPAIYLTGIRRNF